MCSTIVDVIITAWYKYSFVINAGHQALLLHSLVFCKDRNFAITWRSDADPDFDLVGFDPADCTAGELILPDNFLIFSDGDRVGNRANKLGVLWQNIKNSQRVDEATTVSLSFPDNSFLILNFDLDSAHELISDNDPILSSLTGSVSS